MCAGIQSPDFVSIMLKAGYRLLDGAGDYGNEKEAGEGLARAIKDGIVKREEVCTYNSLSISSSLAKCLTVVTSKLWNTFHRKEHVKEAVMRSLADWGVSYFDVYYVHFRKRGPFRKISAHVRMLT